MAALDTIPLPPVGDTSWTDWGTALDTDARALNTAIATKADAAATTAALAGKADTAHNHTGTYQPADPDLTTLAGLTAITDNVIQSVGSAWASRTPAQLKATLALAPADVGLSNVTNVAQGPVRVTVKADTSTAYAPVLTDENQLVTLANAATITVTLPQNSVQAFPIGAEIEFMWLGAGQPVFAAGAGATVNSRNGWLKIDLQYGWARAKKISTNGWHLRGDLAA